MLTFLFLNQTLCYHSLESSRRDDFNEGHIIGFGWEMRKLSWKPFCSLFLNCSPAFRQVDTKWRLKEMQKTPTGDFCITFNLYLASICLKGHHISNFLYTGPLRQIRLDWLLRYKIDVYMTTLYTCYNQFVYIYVQVMI